MSRAHISIPHNIDISGFHCIKKCGLFLDLYYVFKTILKIWSQELIAENLFYVFKTIFKIWSQELIAENLL